MRFPRPVASSGDARAYDAAVCSDSDEDDDVESASANDEPDTYEAEEHARALAKKLMLSQGSPPALQLWAHNRTAANTLQFGGVQMLTVDPHVSLQYFDAALTLSPDAESLYWRAHAHAELGQWHAAIASLNTCVERRRKFPDAFALRGTMYSKLGYLAAALRDYDRAVKQEPYCLQWRMQRGLCKHAGEDFAGAVIDLQDAAAYPDAEEAYYEALGDSYLRLDQPDLARQCLAVAQALGFDSKRLQKLRASTEARLTQPPSPQNTRPPRR